MMYKDTIGRIPHHKSKTDTTVQINASSGRVTVNPNNKINQTMATKLAADLILPGSLIF